MQGVPKDAVHQRTLPCFFVFESILVCTIEVISRVVPRFEARAISEPSVNPMNSREAGAHQQTGDSVPSVGEQDKPSSPQEAVFQRSGLAMNAASAHLPLTYEI